MASLFITATGTDIGKTFVTEHMVRALRKVRQVDAFKPMITGFHMEQDTDSHRLLKALGRDINLENIEEISPIRLSTPLSPDQAARHESYSIDYEQLLKLCRLRVETGLCLIEGLGGVMTPLNSEKLVLDWISDLNLSVLLVSGSYLGALSHTLTAHLALKSRQIPIKAIIVNESEKGCVGTLETKNSLKSFVEETPLFIWPRGQTEIPMDLLEIDALSG